MRLIDPTNPPTDLTVTAPARTAQVIRWAGVTRHDIPVERVLEAARDLRCVVVLGYDQRGEEYFSSSIADGADVIWLLERCKLRLLTTHVEPNEV